MTTKTKAVTEHGEVEYDTVTCASCGNETAKQNAQRFVIGDCVEIDDWTHRGVKEFEFERRSVEMGWACQYCHDGPASFPTRDFKSRLVLATFIGLALGFVVGHMMGVAV